MEENYWGEKNDEPPVETGSHCQKVGDKSFKLCWLHSSCTKIPLDLGQVLLIDDGNRLEWVVFDRLLAHLPEAFNQS